MLFLVLLLVSPLSIAASDTIWLTGNWATCSKAEALYYRLPPVREGAYYRVKDYYKSGAIQYTGLALDSAGLKRHGPCLWYYENGDSAIFSTYDYNSLSGKSVFYYFDNKPKAILNYVNNQLNDTVIEFYINGRIKGTASYLSNEFNGIYTKYYRNGLPSLEKEYVRGYQTRKHKEYYPSGRIKYDHFLEDNQDYRIYTQREDNDMEYLQIKFNNGLPQTVEKVSYYDSTTTTTTSMRIEGGIEHWQVKRGKVLIFDYYFKGTTPTGTATKYDKTGRLIIEKCTFSSASCRAEDPSDVVKHLTERIYWEDIYPEGYSSDCLIGTGFKVTQTGKKFFYKIADGVMKFDTAIGNVAFMANQIDIPVITARTMNEDGTATEDTFTSLPLVDCSLIFFAQSERKVCSVNTYGYIITFIDGEISKTAFDSVNPEKNELVLCYTDLVGSDKKVFSFKIGTDLQFQFKKQILSTSDFSLMVVQLFRNQLQELNSFEAVEILGYTLQEIAKSTKSSYYNAWKNDRGR